MAEATETDKLMENEETPDKKLTKRDGTRCAITVCKVMGTWLAATYVFF